LDDNDVLPAPNWDNGIGANTGWLYQPDEHSPVFDVRTGLLWPQRVENSPGFRSVYTLNLNNITSPSLTTYSLPSIR
jgi:hypothetical protein